MLIHILAFFYIQSWFQITNKGSWPVILLETTQCKIENHNG